MPTEWFYIRLLEGFQGKNQKKQFNFALRPLTSLFLQVWPFLKPSEEVLRKTKKAVTAGLMDDFEPSLKVIEDIYLDELMKTADAQEGLKAFLEKRRPEWKNE